MENFVLPRHLTRKISRLVTTFVGMSGLRVDKWRDWRIFVPWLLIFFSTFIAITLAFSHFQSTSVAAAKKFAIVYFSVTWFTYYIGLSIFLGSNLKVYLIKKLGTTNAIRYYQMVLGVVFFHQGLSQGTMITAFKANTMIDSPIYIFQALGILLMIIGIIAKVWATYIVGLDVYYYQDMFLDETQQNDSSFSFTKKGPYRFFNNPMYGIGNLTPYGTAIFSVSIVGFGAALLCQASIFAFYFLFEKPFIFKKYLLANQG